MHNFVGAYKVKVAWMLFAKAKYTLTLNASHTHDDGFGDVIDWQSTGKNIVDILQRPEPTATYTGKASSKGIGSKNKPRTMSNDTGDCGTWYAVLRSS